MKYKITLNGKTYEVEVEAGQAMLVDEYEAYAPRSPQLLPLHLLPLLPLHPLLRRHPPPRPRPPLLQPVRSSRPRCPATS